MQEFRLWWAISTTREKNALSVAAGTSRKYLYSIASGARIASADLAGRLEAASFAARTLNSRLPLLTRAGICPACAGCPYSPKCESRL